MRQKRIKVPPEEGEAAYHCMSRTVNANPNGSVLYFSNFVKIRAPLGFPRALACPSNRSNLRLTPGGVFPSGLRKMLAHIPRKHQKAKSTWF